MPPLYKLSPSQNTLPQCILGAAQAHAVQYVDDNHVKGEPWNGKEWAGLNAIVPLPLEELARGAPGSPPAGTAAKVGPGVHLGPS